MDHNICFEDVFQVAAHKKSIFDLIIQFVYMDHYGFDKDWKIGKERDKFFIIKSMCMEKSRFVEGVRASLLKAVLYGARVIPKYYID